jgi:amino acid permease
VVNDRRNAPTWITALLVLGGLACIVVGIVYFVEPARSLPSFFPGHLAGSAHHHSKHGIAALIAGLVAWAVAWMTTGSRAPSSTGGAA